MTNPRRSLNRTLGFRLNPKCQIETGANLAALHPGNDTLVNAHQFSEAPLTHLGVGPVFDKLLHGFN